MGASAWSATVPYEADLDAALRRAKRRAFESGRLYDSFGIVADPVEAIERARARAKPEHYSRPLLPADVCFIEEQIETLVRGIRRYQAAGTLDERIEALRLAVGFDGTHCVIDLPSTDALERVPADVLLRRFGTVLPPPEPVGELMDGVLDLVSKRGRFQAVWLVAEDAAGERWIVFVGISGD